MKRFLFALCLLFAFVATCGPAAATVNSTQNRITYAGNGVGTSFFVPFKFQTAADLVVIVRDTATNAEATQTLNVHYSVTGALSESGGTVTFVTAPAAGKTVLIIRSPTQLQDLNLRNTGTLPVEDIERRFDRLTMLVQRLNERVDRCLRMTDGNPTQVDMTLPTTLTASAVPVLNATGGGWSLSTLQASAADLSALTGGGNTTLHFHNADRDRANHTGTQLKSTISDFAITSSNEIAAGVILGSDIGLYTITADNLSTTAGVTTSQIADGTLLNADINGSAAIDLTKLQTIGTDKLLGRVSASTGAIEQITITDFVQSLLGATDAAAFRSTTGAAASSITISGSGGISGGGDLSANRTLTINDNALPFTKIQGSGSQSKLFGTFGGLTTQAKEIPLTSNIEINGFGVLAITQPGIGTAELSDNSVTSAKILDGAVGLSDMASIAAGTILARGSDAGTGAPQVLTIGAGLSSAGGILQAVGGAATITVKEGGVTVGGASFNTLDFSSDDFDIAESPSGTATVVLGTNSVESATIQDDTIVAADINSAAAIPYSKLLFNNNIVAGDIATDAVDSAEIKADAVGSSEIAADAVGASEIAANSVDTSEIVGGAPGATGAELADTVTNISAATDLTLDAKGDEVVLADCLRLASLSASPAQVGGMSYDTDDKAVVVKTDLGVQRFTPIHSSQTTDSSAIFNTVAETSFDQLPTSFPANTLVAGRVIRWTAVYLYSNTGTPTMRLKFKMAGTATKVIGDTGTQTQANLSNEIMVARGTLTILTAGASGTYRCSVEVSAITGSSITFINGGPTSRFGSPDSSIDTTQINTLTDTWIWGTASASNTIKRVMFIVEG